ncbi:MAG: hypothetical protein A3K83_04465 [Omnitrophica WOR_2 bacterium RBG_13_44_8b]|nr:MAG: hypothetical protein A3K83_04465 [Omnitrophica WOR_2 bacterium RBG_13_44_8b]
MKTYKLIYTCPTCCGESIYECELTPNPTWWVSLECKLCGCKSESKFLDEQSVKIEKIEAVSANYPISKTQGT